jgi:valyl-tRNA synthetase
MIGRFLIDVPPPTISGLLHLGHVFSYAQMDFCARYAAWRGKQLVYPFCFDNNGLPTEKLALKEGITDPDEMRKFSYGVSKEYAALFHQLGMAFPTGQYYATFDKKSVELCLMSFNDLKAKGLVYKAEAEYWYCPLTQVSVSQSELDENGCFERSGVKAELRKGTGWFIDILNHIPRIRKAIDEIEWKPDIFRERLHRWLDDLKFDWSISRERKFGIKIPREETPTFDTWFVSSLTPQLAFMGAEDANPTLYAPIFDVRFQAHDIIRTWALYTIVKSLYHNDQIPWKSIVVSGHALDPQGRKISKSAGNFVPPKVYFDKYGSDGLRYWAAHTVAGTDTKTDESVMNKGKKLVNKIKNARKFLLAKANEGDGEGVYGQWLMVKDRFIAHMDAYEWQAGAELLFGFFWDDFCGDDDRSVEENPDQQRLEPHL